jgi:hypothetical protein
MTVNWDILNGPANSPNSLRPGEQVTGPLELFNGVVYFGTFVTDVQANNACSFGYSRLWGVDYVEHVGSNLHEPVARLPHPTIDDTEMVAFDHTISGFESLQNGLLMGVGIAARPRCNSFDEPPGETDPYLGNPQAPSPCDRRGACAVRARGADLGPGNGRRRWRRGHHRA